MKLNFIKNIIVVATVFSFVFSPVFSSLASAEVMSSGNYGLQSDSLNFGGGNSSSGSYGLESTAGEVGTGDLSGTSYNAFAGYQQSGSTTVAVTPTPTTDTDGSSSGSRPYPINPINFVATPKTNSINLSWQYSGPATDTFRVVRSDTFFPNDISDGQVIFEGNALEIIDNNVSVGTRYYYALFAKDIYGRYSSGVLAQARITPAGEIEKPVTAEDIFKNVPDATNIHESFSKLTLLDFDFIQGGVEIEHANNIVSINGKEELTIRLDYNKVPEILKTIAITLTDPDDASKFFTFLLRVNKDKTAYEATIGALGKSGNYKINVTILDYKNQGLKRITGDLKAFVFGGVKGLLNNYGINLNINFIIIILLIIIAIIVAFVLSRRYKRVFAAFIIFAFIFSNFAFYTSTTHAAINKQINYQGKLVDSSGDLVTDGTYAMEFKLYTVSSGGSAIYTETLSGGNEVQVTNGLFSVMLGAVSSLASVDFNQTLYLGVNVESDGEMTPRKIIGAVPSAFVAEVADTLDGLDSTQFLRSDIGSVTSGYFVSTTTNATSTFAGGIDLSDGCFAIDGVCLSAGGSSYTNADANAYIHASSTISKTYTANTFTALQTFSSGISLGTALSVANGGTGQASFGQGWLHSDGTTFTSSTSPTVNYITATSTTATSTFAGGLAVGSNYLNVLQNGNVGIGTASPDYKLEVAGNVGVDEYITHNDDTNTYLRFQSDQISLVSGNYYVLDSTGFNGYINIGASNNSADVRLQSANGSLLLKGSTGNIGIGTTTPYAKLSVVGEIVAANFTATTTATSTFGGSIAVTETNATSTFAGGIDLSDGCFAVDGVCLSVGGGSYGDTNVNAYIHASTTIPKTYTANTFTALQTFNYASTTAISASATIKAGTSTVSNSVDSVISIMRSVDNSVTGNGHAFSDSSQVNRTGTIGYNSFDARINIVGTQNYDHYAAFQALPSYDSSGTMTNYYGLFSGLNKTAGTITNAHGVYVDAITGGTNNYGIYVEDNNSVFRDDSAGEGIPLTVTNNNGGDSSSATLAFNNASTNAVTGKISNFRVGSGNYAMTFQNFGATGLFEAMRINNSGNVGIGTTSPYAKLSVVGPVVAQYFHATSTTATSTIGGSLVVGGPRVFSAYSVTGGLGNIAAGDAQAGTAINASGQGAFAYGQTTSSLGGTSLIRSSGQGSLAGGVTSGIFGSATTTSSGSGSIAWGYTVAAGPGTSANLTSSGTGSIVLGAASNKNLTSSAIGSFAGGYASAGNILSSADGAFAFGDNITASAALSTAFGSGFTNNTANSFMVGYGSTPTLTVDATNVGIGTTSPYAKLSVVGQAVAAYFTATTSTASTFPYASTTAITSTGSAYFGTSSGGVLIGTTTAASTSKLTLAGGNFIHTAVGDPTLKGTYNTSGTSGGVYVSGKYAYVADITSLQIIDISNPGSPTSVGSYSSSGSLSSVFVSGKYAYVTVSSLSGTFLIIDVSNPALPTLVGTANTGSDVNYSYVSGKYAYVSDGFNGLKIFDISDPRSPLLLSTYPSVAESTGVYVSGKYAYVADADSGLQVIDISNPASPSLMGTYNTSGYANSVYVSGKYAYVADGSSGLQIVNISNPASPALVGTYNTTGTAYDVYVSGRYAYVTDDTSGVHVIDVLNPASPSFVGTYNTSGNAYGIYVSGKYAYVADGTSGLQILDINGIETPSLYAGNIETNVLNATENIIAGGDIYAQGGLNVGISGIFSRGTISAFIASTTQTNPVVATFMGGNVGIGTTSPWRRLSVNGSSDLGINALAGYFTATTSTASTFPYASTTAITSSGSAYFATTGGNVGIGTTSPYAKLSVVGPVVAEYFNATSTTATSTFAGGVAIGGPFRGQVSPYTKVEFSDPTGGYASDWSFDLASGFGTLNFGASGGTYSSRSVRTLIPSVIGTYQYNTLGMISGRTWDGTAFKESSAISFEYDAALGTNDVPGAISFYTSADGTATPRNRMMIRSSGNVGIGTTSPYAILTTWGATTGKIFEAVTSASTTALSISATGFATTTVSGLTIAGSATSTSNVGFNLSGGCFAVNGTCVGGSSSGSSFAYPFTPTTNYSSTNQATTGIAWFQNGINASSTSHFVNASTTMISVNDLLISSPVANSLFVGTDAGMGATSALNSHFIGYNSGNSATNAYEANFIGISAGNGATNANNSNFIGMIAGQHATDASYSNFFGWGAGEASFNSSYSNFMGQSAGAYATYAEYSNFIGAYAGYSATNASTSNFIGYNAGTGAADANNSIFLGYQSGYYDTVNNIGTGKSSILIGDYTSTGGFSNSIAIGQGTANSAARQINLGNVLYATGIYNGITPSSIPTSGNIGIGTSSPYAKLSVVGPVVAEYFHATSTTATSTIAGGLDVNSGGLLYDFNTGITSIGAIETGAFNFDTDAGQVNWVNLPVTSSAVSGLVQSYTASIADISLLTLYAEATGVDNTVRKTAVGIGSTTPMALLTIQNNAFTASSTYDFFIASTTAAYATTTHFAITNTGNVGVGTSTPWATFAINPTAGYASNQFVIGSSTATSFLVNNSGNVGIGTTTPQAKFDVYSNDNTIARFKSYSVQPTITLGYDIWGGETGITMDDGSHLLVGDFDSDYVGIGDGSLNVKYTGNVGIGTTSPWKTLSVTGTVAIDGLTAAGASGDALCLGAGKEVQVNTGAQTCTVSSARFKNNIANLDIGLEALNKLNPVSFIYNGSTENRIGFIAEEVGAVDKRLIFTEADGVTPRGVRYEDMVAVLAKAIKEQQVQINAFQSATSTSNNTHSTSTIIVNNNTNSSNSSSNLSEEAIAAITSNASAAALSGLTAVVADLFASSTVLNNLASSTGALVAGNVADTLASSTPSFISRVASAVIEGLKSSTEWVFAKITATLAIFDRVETKTLCIGETCVNEDQLKALLAQAGVPAATATTTATTTPVVVGDEEGNEVKDFKIKVDNTEDTTVDKISTTTVANTDTSTTTTTTILVEEPLGNPIIIEEPKVEVSPAVEVKEDIKEEVTPKEEVKEDVKEEKVEEKKEEVSGPEESKPAEEKTE